MGYSLFASRKLHYQSMINNINSQLDNITQQKQSLLTLSANISDGKVTVDELVSDPMNLNNYLGFIASSQAFKESDSGAGSVSATVGNFLTDKQYSPEAEKAILQLLDESLGIEFAKAQSKKLVAQENQLELQQKRLETKLETARKQLEAVERAEAEAIKNAVPKYAGLG